MLSYLLKRLLNGFFVLFGVVSVVFFLFNVLPGDAAQMTLGQRSDISSVEAVNRELGLDKPLYQQYFIYLNDLSILSLHEATEENREKYQYRGLFNLGEYTLVLKPPYLRRSYQSRQTVNQIIVAAVPGTAVLALAAMVIATFFGLLLGGLAALFAHSWIDRTAVSLSIIGISAPSYFASILVAYLFGFVWQSFTGLSMTGSLFVVDPFEGRRLALQNLILPAVTLGIRPLAIIVQLSRNTFLEVLGQDYVRTARAKGLSEWQVMRRHVLRNALGPVITAVSGWFASLLAGAVFVEYIFGWKGLGKVTVDALMKFDLPVVMGAVLFIALAFIVINILVDLAYAWLDPRIRLQ
ncbi:MAG: ABC transporter permease [Bacteroidia bacterium]